MLRQLKDFIIRLFIVVRVRREERKLMRETGLIWQEGEPKSRPGPCWRGEMDGRRYPSNIKMSYGLTLCRGVFTLQNAKALVS